MMNPYHAICGATFLAFIPVPMRVALLAGASGGVLKYNNVTPRMAMDDLKSKDKLSESQAALAQRLTGAQANGWENLPVFIGAVLGSLQAGVDKQTVGSVCAFYVACRFSRDALHAPRHACMYACMPSPSRPRSPPPPPPPPCRTRARQGAHVRGGGNPVRGI
eukprot:Tamp_26276.p3 GENE.Tamp_26276~~Tamp_26276.p3  ORF type:complete len:170 (-),score=33.60 Tamp_26276:395-883(-)